MIRKVLDCSWHHVSATTRERLESEESMRTMVGEDGYLVHVQDPEYASDDDEDDTPADLLAVLAHARANGCDFVMLDRDADYIDGLTVYGEDA